MNIRNVLRTYSLLRQLGDDETALLETLRDLSEGERDQLVESLSPVKAVKKPDSKPRVYEHCAQCDKTKAHSFHKDSSNDGYHEFQSSKPKSPRASSLAAQIKTGTRPLDGAASKMRCAACGNVEDYADHSEPSPHYHPFASSVRSVQPSSSASNGDQSTTANIAGETESVSSVGASGGGD